MLCRWIIDGVVRVEIDGKEVALYQGLEFEVNEQNEYIEKAIANGFAEKVETPLPAVSTESPQPDSTTEQGITEEEKGVETFPKKQKQQKNS